MTKLKMKFKGGPGSGDFGHSGRKGMVGGSSGSYSFNSPMLGEISVPKKDVEKAKKLNRIAVANQNVPNLEAYYSVKRDNDGTLYAITDITPDAEWMKSGDPALAYNEDFMWLDEAKAYVFVGHTDAWNG